jgi:hypothetical protein
VLFTSRVTFGEATVAFRLPTIGRITRVASAYSLEYRASGGVVSMIVVDVATHAWLKPSRPDGST